MLVPWSGAAMSEQPILYGASYSVYVRAVRLTLAEKGVPYTLVLSLIHI